MNVDKCARAPGPGTGRIRRSALLWGAPETLERIVFESLLAVEPTGEMFVVPIRPHSAQSVSIQKEKDTIVLKEKISTILKPYLTALRAQAAQNGGGLLVKVLFLLGRNETEKDLDNMLKWFLDVWKKACGADDSCIVDLRATKARLPHSEEGRIGLSLASPSLNPENTRQGKTTDLLVATGLAMQACGGKDPGDSAWRLALNKVRNTFSQATDRLRGVPLR